MSSAGDVLPSEDPSEIGVPVLDVMDVHAGLCVDFRTNKRFLAISADPSTLLIPLGSSIHDAVPFNGARDLADKSREDCFLLPMPRPGSVQYPVARSLNLMFGQSKSHKILSAPRPSCICPQIASEGRTRHNVSRNVLQPNDLTCFDSSQWYLGGVCVITMSVSRSI